MTVGKIPAALQKAAGIFWRAEMPSAACVCSCRGNGSLRIRRLPAPIRFRRQLSEKRCRMGYLLVFYV